MYLHLLYLKFVGHTVYANVISVRFYKDLTGYIRSLQWLHLITKVKYFNCIKFYRSPKIYKF